MIMKSLLCANTYKLEFNSGLQIHLDLDGSLVSVSRTDEKPLSRLEFLPQSIQAEIYKKYHGVAIMGVNTLWNIYSIRLENGKKMIFSGNGRLLGEN